MKNKVIGLAAGILICTATVMADTFPDTLWIGNDGTAAAGILNTTTDGTFLRQILDTSALGLAVDSNKLYVNIFDGGNTYDLDTLAVNGAFSLPLFSFSLDMTFSGGFIWAADRISSSIDQVDPTTGAVGPGTFFVPFTPLGLTTDGAGGFWVSEFFIPDPSDPNQPPPPPLRHFNSSGVQDGTMDPTDIAGVRGGLGFDPRDGTLFIGTQDAVYHYTTTGTDLGFFATPGRLVYGLEFDPAPVPAPVPEPASIVLLGTVALAAAGIQRRLRAR